jgi:hypothetical protein
MTTGQWTRPRVATLAMVAAAALAAAPAASAQTGPLTETLREQEPPDYAFKLGPFLFSPNLSIRELGIDTNVFDEPDNPKRDFTIGLQPDLQVYANLGLLTFTGVAASDFTYFHEYSSERSSTRQYQGRLEGRFSLIRPFVAAALNNVRTRPTAEIDLRARREETELTAGVAAAVSPIARVFVMATRLDTAYSRTAVFRDVSLAEALNRTGDTVTAGLRMQATPFTTVTISGGRSEERFDVSGRDAVSRGVKVDVEFSPDAVLRGKASLGFEEMTPVDDTLPGYTGVIGRAGLNYSAFERATLAFDVNRLVQYSYDEDAVHFVQTGADVTLTYRVAGPYDAQIRASRQWLDYALEADDPVVNGYSAGLGYNMRDNSRIGINFEYAERVADERPDLRFDRRRIYASYTYGFRR